MASAATHHDFFGHDVVLTWMEFARGKRGRGCCWLREGRAADRFYRARSGKNDIVLAPARHARGFREAFSTPLFFF